MPMRPPIHRPIGPRPGRTPPRKSAPFYHSNVWRQQRARVLKRDGYQCRIRLPGCTLTADTVDHIRARTEQGADEDTNLRASCRACHNRRHPEKAKAPRD